MNAGTAILITFCLAVVVVSGYGFVRSHHRERARNRRFNDRPAMEWSEFLKTVTTFALTEKMIAELCVPETDRYMTLAPVVRGHFLSMEPFVLTPAMQRWMAQNCGPWGQVPHALLPKTSRTDRSGYTMYAPTCVLWFANPDDAFNFKMRYA